MVDEAAKSARGRLREFLRGQIEAKDEFHLSDLTDQAMKELSRDPDFMASWLDEYMRPAIQSEVQQIVASTRRLEVRGDVAATPEKFEEKVVRFKSRFANWREHAGDFGHIKLQKMSRPQLEMAARERLERGRSETVLGKTWLKLAQGMKDDQLVEDVYTDEQLERTYQDVNGTENEI